MKFVYSNIFLPNSGLMSYRIIIFAFYNPIVLTVNRLLQLSESLDDCVLVGLSPRDRGVDSVGGGEYVPPAVQHLGHQSLNIIMLDHM